MQGMTSVHGWPPHWSAADFLDDQQGVVSRAQLLGAGETPADIRRMIRRRDLAVVHPGIYVSHTGDPTWVQRTWAAVLHAWPAALAGEAALRACEGPGKRADPAIIEVAVGRSRTVLAPPGVRITRIDRLAQRAVWTMGPPRLRYDDAAIAVACRAATDLDALRVLADVGPGPALHRRPSGRRAGLAATGAPPSVVDGRGDRVAYRDVEHADGLVVELDGRLFHDSARQRDADMERDLDAALVGKETVRLGWGQVFGRECVTAGKVAALHVSRGWAGRPHPCGDQCGIGATR